MKKDLFPQDWADDFQDFSTIGKIQPPEHLTQQIFQTVHADLNPPAWRVFSKVTLIHAVVGTVTLLFCPQFGIAPLSDLGLMNFFMKYGETACMLGCGAFYVGTSLMAASLILTVDEVRMLRRTEALQIPLLGLLSVAVFICFGATAIFSSLTLLWLLGSILGGLATLELGWLVRRKIRSLG